MNQLHQVSEQYHGSGAAGGLVLLGVGEFVNQDDIWTRKALKPGAAMQVWKRTSDFERIKRGRHPDLGTSFVFLHYAGDDAMSVLHFERREPVTKSDFEVWIGANLSTR
ncbi:MAG: hypothetical protein R2856_02170 [Caldilineaceae bacterium]